jgi:NADP-dependent aldehyde dehydrogenase
MEVFGPTALLVRVKDVDQLMGIARQFRGQLSATLQIDAADHALAARLIPLLERRTGRIVVNPFSHPQEVSYVSIHGGPFPATSDSRFTSVGMTAIEPFLRPVCYQGFPDELLPEALKRGNPAGIWRLNDGELSKASNARSRCREWRRALCIRRSAPAHTTCSAAFARRGRAAAFFFGAASLAAASLARRA